MAFYKCKVLNGNATGICYQSGSDSIVESNMKKSHRGYISDLCVILTLMIGSVLMIAALILTSIEKYYESFSMNIGIFILCLILSFTVKRDIY